MTDDNSADLEALADWLDEDELRLPPVKSREYPDGKVYTVESPDAETGSRIAALATILVRVRGKGEGAEVSERDVARLKLNEEETRDLTDWVLGDTLDEMKADGVKHSVVQKLTLFLFLWHGIGPEAAQKAAADGLLSAGKARAPQNRAERRAGAKSARTGNTGSSSQ